MGNPKKSILIGISIINHPFWGTTILGNPHIISQHNATCCTSQLTTHMFPAMDGTGASSPP